MKRTLLTILVLAIALMAGTASAADMIADGGDEKIDVGDVTVVLDYPYFDVTFTTVDGWVMTETHVQVFFEHPITGELIGIRLKKGNPAPGKFDFKHEGLGGVTLDEYDDEIDVVELADVLVDPGLYNIYVAGHASVQKEIDTTFVSEAGTRIQVYGPVTGYLPLGDALWTGPVDAVATWVHPAWPSISGATWISDAFTSTGLDTYRWFHDEITVPGPPVSGTVTATSDNAEEFYANGALVYTDGEVQGAWVDDHEWGTVLTNAFTPVMGLNELDFIVRNYPAGADGGPSGLIYRADITYLREETAWGGTNTAGLLSEQFSGRNWAIYFHSGWLFVVFGPTSDGILVEHLE
jgi:hypothetical protein